VRTILPALGLVTAVLVLAACGGGDSPGVAQGTDLANGRQQFVDAGCGGCHALEAAGTNGTVGPDLDAAFRGAREQGFAESTFEQVVRSQIAYPGIDSQMPADLVTGKNADDVAYFVAQCAAAEGEDPQCTPPPPPGGTTGGGGGGGEADGAAIFTANCATCHTLAAAGTTGTIGPNLDDAKPSMDLVVERVTNGMGVMPSFKGTLSDEQIQAVAKYVSENAGK
jgi:mono/diheme cytochrome c family protein